LLVVVESSSSGAIEFERRQEFLFLQSLSIPIRRTGHVDEGILGILTSVDFQVKLKREMGSKLR
jgi:hypothetical protein